MDTEQRSRTILIGIGAAVVVLVAIAVVLAIQPPELYDPATPEGAAQGYSRPSSTTTPALPSNT